MSTELLNPLFIDGSRGQLFCLWAYADDNKFDGKGEHLSRLASRACDNGQSFILFLPPFGEEVNICRRFFSLLRAQLTNLGKITVQPDLFGTGDSSGSLHEATWSQWRDDLRTVIRHILGSCIESTSRPSISIIGARAGCLMAQDIIEFIEREPHTLSLRNLVFVQPEQTGEDIVNRLFRARVLAQRIAGNKSQNTQDLWAMIERGRDVQAGGHKLSASLCRSLCEQNIDSILASSSGLHKTWFDLQAELRPSEVNRLKSNSWDINVNAHTPFWKSYEHEPEKSLLEDVVVALVR